MINGDLDQFCIRIYGEPFEELPTDLQRFVEYLYKKGGLKL